MEYKYKYPQDVVLGSEIMDFFNNHWLGDNWYYEHEEMYDAQNRISLKPDALYNLRHFSAVEDDYMSFYDAFWQQMSPILIGKSYIDAAAAEVLAAFSENLAPELASIKDAKLHFIVAQQPGPVEVNVTVTKEALEQAEKYGMVIYVKVGK